jgi:hypothetical protein
VRAASRQCVSIWLIVSCSKSWHVFRCAGARGGGESGGSGVCIGCVGASAGMGGPGKSPHPCDPKIPVGRGLAMRGVGGEFKDIAGWGGDGATVYPSPNSSSVG